MSLVHNFHLHMDVLFPNFLFFLSSGHHHFRMLILPALLRVSEGQEKARVVITSSSAAYGADEVKYGGLKKDMDVKAAKERKKMGPMGVYWQSKWVGTLDMIVPSEAVSSVGLIIRVRTGKCRGREGNGKEVWG